MVYSAVILFMYRNYNFKLGIINFSFSSNHSLLWPSCIKGHPQSPRTWNIASKSKKKKEGGEENKNVFKARQHLSKATPMCQQLRGLIWALDTELRPVAHGPEVYNMLTFSLFLCFINVNICSTEYIKGGMRMLKT